MSRRRKQLKREAERRVAAVFQDSTISDKANVIAFRDDGRFLICRRSRQGTWCLPGGSKDSEEESSVGTAVREFHEETGLFLKDLQKLGRSDYEDYIIHAFRAIAIPGGDGSLVPNHRHDHEDEIDSFKWVSPEELSTSSLKWAWPRDVTLEFMGIALPQQGGNRDTPDVEVHDVGADDRDGRPTDSEPMDSRDLIPSSLIACSFPVPMSPDGKAPTEFKLWPIGHGEMNVEVEKPSPEGPKISKYVVDAEAVTTMVSNWQRRGIRLMGDYEHQSLNPAHKGEVPASCKGWELEAREGWVWAANVRWTRKAKLALEEGEYAYVSPVFDYDRKTRRITFVVNFALTNTPATNQIPALVAAKSIAWTDDEDGSPLDISESRGSLGRMAATAQPKFSKLGTAMQKCMAENKHTPEEMAKACGLGVDSMNAMMGAMPGGLTPEHHAAIPKIATYMKMPLHHVRAMAHGDPAPEDPDDDDDDDDPDDDAPARKESSMLTPKKAMKKAEKKLAKKAAKRVAASVAESVDAVKTSMAAELETVKASLAARDAKDKLEAEARAKRDAEIEKEKCASMIVAAKAEHKLFTKDQEEHAKVFAAKFGSAELASYLAAQPKGGPGTFESPQERGMGANGVPDPELACLTRQDWEVAKMMGTDPKKLAEFKKSSYQDDDLFPGPTPVEGLRGKPGDAVDVPLKESDVNADKEAGQAV